MKTSIHHLGVCLSVLLVGVACGQGIQPLSLRLVDQHNKPVADVTVQLKSLVFDGDSAVSLSAAGVASLNEGELVTREDGTLSIRLPDPNMGELARFSMTATHPGFAQFDGWLEVSEAKPTEVKLSRGVRLAATAVDAQTGEPIVENLYAIAEQKDQPSLIDWKTNGQGLLLSRRLGDADQRVRLVQIIDAVAIRFSDPVDVPSGGTELRMLNDIPMKPAQTFRGRLEPGVPRPVHNGQITVCVTWPTEQEKSTTGPVGHWLATAPIENDGSFTVPGLPAGDWLQCIASCDGYFQKPAEPKRREKAFPGPSRFGNLENYVLPAIVDWSDRSDVALPMQKTASGSVRFYDQAANPVPHETAIVMRSQLFFNAAWATRDYRAWLSTADELVHVRQGKPYRTQAPRAMETVTDARGVARFENVPGTKVAVGLKGYRSFDRGTWQRITLSPDEVVEVTVIPRD